MNSPYTIPALLDVIMLTAIIFAPLIIGGVVSLWPGERPDRKFLFVLFCGVLAYGSGALVYLLSAPIQLANLELFSYMYDDGLGGLVNALKNAESVLGWAALCVCAVASFVGPIWLRKGAWRRLVTSAA